MPATPQAVAVRRPACASPLNSHRCTRIRLTAPKRASPCKSPYNEWQNNPLFSRPTIIRGSPKSNIILSYKESFHHAVLQSQTSFLYEYFSALLVTPSIKIPRPYSVFIPTFNPTTYWNRNSLLIKNNDGFLPGDLLVYLHSERASVCITPNSRFVI